VKTLWTAPQANGRRIRLTTDTKVDPRDKTRILGTEFYLSIPRTVPHEFSIGQVRFEILDKGVKALDPIPASWFVDLSADIEQEEDETMELFA
jgi:hypothetical protein